MNGNQEALLALFLEVLESYRGAEEMVIDERGGDLDALAKEVEDYKNEFLGLLEDEALQQKADAACEEYYSEE